MPEHDPHAPEMQVTPEVGGGLLAFSFAVLFLLWVLLTGSLAFDELLTGVVVSALITWVSRPHLHVLDAVVLEPAALLALFKYLGYFLFALLRANLDLAGRVIAPSLPINPQMLEIRTGLQSGLGRMLLANSITLTPGTLTVDMEGDRLLIHFVYTPPGESPLENARRTADEFERHIRGFLR